MLPSIYIPLRAARSPPGRQGTPSVWGLGRVPNAAESPMRPRRRDGSPPRRILRCLTPANRRPQGMGESDYEEADDDFDDEGAAVRIP